MIFRGGPCWNSKTLRLSLTPEAFVTIQTGSAMTITWFIFSRCTAVRKHA
jgi:hypothetical protein